jgi:hypothetical protein
VIVHDVTLSRSSAAQCHIVHNPAGVHLALALFLSVQPCHRAVGRRQPELGGGPPRRRGRRIAARPEAAQEQRLDLRTLPGRDPHQQGALGKLGQPHARW